MSGIDARMTFVATVKSWAGELGYPVIDKDLDDAPANGNYLQLTHVEDFHDNPDVGTTTVLFDLALFHTFAESGTTNTSIIALQDLKALQKKIKALGNQEKFTYDADSTIAPRKSGQYIVELHECSGNLAKKRTNSHISITVELLTTDR